LLPDGPTTGSKANFRLILLKIHPMSMNRGENSTNGGKNSLPGKIADVSSRPKFLVSHCYF